MHSWNNRCGRDFEYWDAEAVPNEAMHAFKLRLNLSHEQYLRCRDILVDWLRCNCPDWVFSFKTFTNGIDFQVMPERFQGAGQFTIYLKQGVSTDEVNAFCQSMERFVSALLVDESAPQKVMVGDYAITKHVSSRFERLAWLENAYMSARMIKSEYFWQLYCNALRESEFYLKTYRSQHQRLPYDEDIDKMMTAGLGYAAEMAPRVSARRDGMLCQEVAAICRGMLQNPSVDLVPLTSAFQALMKGSNVSEKALMQHCMRRHVDRYFKRHFHIEKMSTRLVNTDVLALKAHQYVRSLSLFKTKLAGATRLDKTRIARCWLSSLDRCTKDRFSFFWVMAQSQLSQV